MNQEYMKFNSVKKSKKENENENMAYLLEISKNSLKIVELANTIKDDELSHLSRIVLLSASDKILFIKNNYL